MYCSHAGYLWVRFWPAFPHYIIIALEPAFYFGALEYEVEESSGALDVQVWRSGSDLSHPGSVTIYSRGAPHLGAKGALRVIFLQMF